MGTLKYGPDHDRELLTAGIALIHALTALDGRARIEIPAHVVLPARVYLIHLRDRMAFEADIIWFTRRDAGLAIRRMLPIGELREPELAYLKRVWERHCQGDL